MATVKKKSNYSFKTSLPAYLENQVGKNYQNAVVLLVIGKHKGKKATIKEIQDYLRRQFKIILPQSTISGRIGDLREENKIAFSGELKMYRDRLRKVFQIIKKKKKATKKSKKIVRVRSKKHRSLKTK